MDVKFRNNMFCLDINFDNTELTDTFFLKITLKYIFEILWSVHFAFTDIIDNCKLVTEECRKKVYNFLYFFLQ